ncbi:PiggyBac transposable element-derived protein 4 [Eumeta japonica]|uniref:PiggyBac transposable element-derived protein 4 n=1 Tax=Eumeta variegata TaxID=151549 RepID=A0A4C1TIH8_EUMVA|nr:PiggyBac transposable element-derived protein 4 [Eumeta japonica]
MLTKKLKRGENISRFNDGVHVGKWKDKRDVTYITNQYTNCLTPVTNRRGQVKDKPLAIDKYNQFMSGVDRQDQLLSFYPSLDNSQGRKRTKASEQINNGASTPEAGASEAMQVNDVIVSKSILDCIDIDYVRTPIIKDTFNCS